MIVNERETEEGLLVTICDDDVLGETFDSGELSLTVSEEFYGGSRVDREAAAATLARASIANIVGEAAVAMAIEEGFIDEANVLDVGRTRHAQLLWM